jgi:hypothetical protein
MPDPPASGIPGTVPGDGIAFFFSIAGDHIDLALFMPFRRSLDRFGVLMVNLSLLTISLIQHRQASQQCQILDISGVISIIIYK